MMTKKATVARKAPRRTKRTKRNTPKKDQTTVATRMPKRLRNTSRRRKSSWKNRKSGTNMNSVRKANWPDSSTKVSDILLFG